MSLRASKGMLNYRVDMQKNAVKQNCMLSLFLKGSWHDS